MSPYLHKMFAIVLGCNSYTGFYVSKISKKFDSLDIMSIYSLLFSYTNSSRIVN